MRCVLLCLGLLLSPMLASGALPKQEPTPDQTTSLAGQLLIAAPSLNDPNFQHTVILMVKHNKDGALGVVINRPVEGATLTGLLQQLGQDTNGLKGNSPVYVGGPVEPQIALVVHSLDYHRSDTIDIDGRVAMTADPQVLLDIAHERGPHKSIVAFGYAGWGPDQLDKEMAAGAWLLLPEDPSLVFDADRKTLWGTLVKRGGIPL
jgi:putative transcriptional regulator